MSDEPRTAAPAKLKLDLKERRRLRKIRAERYMNQIDSGIRQSEIARLEGVSDQRIQQIIAEFRPFGWKPKTEYRDWSYSDMRILRRLWLVGKTTREIGEKIGCSKNAVIGKAHRMGLPDRPSPIKRNAEKNISTANFPLAHHANP
jgi:hypothetical protein